MGSFGAVVSGLALAAAAHPAGLSAPIAARPVQVMVLGTFHMANPGQDLHNLKVDDMLAPGRQREIKAVVDGLARFRPTVVAVEAGTSRAADAWAAYRTATVAPSDRDETVQVGFRLARQAGAEVHGIDVKGEFPFEALQAYARAHGQTAALDRVQAFGAYAVQSQARALADGGVAATFRLINGPVWQSASQGAYRDVLRVGGEDAQPGAALLSAWYARNIRICANLVQMAKPGDRIVVLYGAGHALLLRQCVAETPGFALVEPSAYLPR